jgi:hypothetical protein
MPVFLFPALRAPFGLPQLIGELADSTLALIVGRGDWGVIVGHGILLDAN